MQTSIFVGLDTREAQNAPAPISDRDITRIAARLSEAKRRADRIAHSERVLADLRLMDRAHSHDDIRPKPPLNQFTVLDFSDKVCHWPMSEHSPYLFCGAPKPDRDDVSYCCKHAAIAYRPR